MGAGNGGALVAGRRGGRRDDRLQGNDGRGEDHGAHGRGPLQLPGDRGCRKGGAQHEAWPCVQVRNGPRGATAPARLPKGKRAVSDREPRRGMLSRRGFLALGGAALATAAGVPLYAWQVEPHWVEVVRRPMLLENLPSALEGRTLLQVSDVHVGPRVSSEYLIDAFDRARALAPDFVVFTGDFVTYRSADEYRELERVLRHAP